MSDVLPRLRQLSAAERRVLLAKLMERRNTGTGLLLFQLAADCARYVATDFSPRVVGGLRRECARLGLRQVEVLERRADDFAGLEAGPSTWWC